MGRPVGRQNRATSRSTSAKNNTGGFADMIVGPSVADAQRMVFLYGDVSEQSVANAVAQVLHLSYTSSSPITLVISTYGGSVDELFALYDVMKFVPCPVFTVGLGKVMSAGVPVLAAGVKGKRLIGATSRIMIHPISGESQGNIFNIVNAAKQYEVIQKTMSDLIVKETKLTTAKIEQIMTLGHDHYLTATEAVKLGIADIIIG
jgi:ATP-dependent Clp protease protease subunit